MKKIWSLDVDDQRVAWLTFDVPGQKVNTFSAAAIGELDRQLDEIMARGNLAALVIRSGKPDSFIAGADIDELAGIVDADDARSKADVGHWLFRKLESMRMPTVAAIHGACMGGGLEMALACDYRLASDHPKTRIGLPEVNLGIVPGWGGTYRLPRLVGLTAGLQMIASGRPVNGRKARRLGLVDGIVAPGFLEEQTRRFLDEIATPAGAAAVRRRRLRGRPLWSRVLASTAPGRALICALAARQVRAKTKGHYPAPLEAIRVVRRSWARRPSDAARIECDAFAGLACTPISRHLVWLFQASQRARRLEGAGGRRSTSIERAAVVGAGIMGGGIAWALSSAGLPVRMKDINWDATARGMAAAAGIYRGMVRRRKLTEAEATMAMHRISPAVDYAGFGRIDVVIEAVVEDLEIKRRVLREIEDHVRPDTIICTNTSSLPLADLASALRNPRRFVGLHFFNPVHRMPLVEVVAGPQTLKRAVVAAAELVRRIEKTPLVVGDCPGFLVNRILLPYLIESAWMFEEGVAPARIDRLLERFGMPMGPMALVDEVGLDVGYEVAKVLEGAYGERMRVPAALGAV
ncbi:MAG: 3-hydroxyacyl-CoA dehydrogenase NAD-binding domain-containing protein, partial [Planctomycetota bacterium]